MGGYAGLRDSGAGPASLQGSLPSWEWRVARWALTGRRVEVGSSGGCWSSQNGTAVGPRRGWRGLEGWCVWLGSSWAGSRGCRAYERAGRAGRRQGGP